MKERYVKLSIFSHKDSKYAERQTLKKAFRVLKSEMEKHGLDYEVNLCDEGGQYGEFGPMLTEIKTATVPLHFIDKLYNITDQTECPRFVYVVEILNNVYSNCPDVAKYYCPETHCAFKTIDDIVQSVDSGDLSKCKILKIEDYNFNCLVDPLLHSKLSKSISKVEPWSPFKGDGTMDSRIQAVWFKELLNLRENTNLSYSEEYIKRLNGLKKSDYGIVVCKELNGRIKAIDGSKIVSIAADCSSPENPGIKIDGEVNIIVETKSFFRALLGITDFSPMKIYRVMPELIDEDLPESIMLESDDFHWNGSMFIVDLIAKIKSELEKKDLEEEDEDIDLSKIWDEKD